MSEQNGSIPGTYFGRPDHPWGSHRYGCDIDITYYQKSDPSLWLKLESLLGGDEVQQYARPICRHTLYGIDVHHCTQLPKQLDLQRTAMMIIYVSEHPDIRVIGVDGLIGRSLIKIFNKMVRENILTVEQRKKIPLAYEYLDTRSGWFHNHHNHFHISMKRKLYSD